MIWKCGEKLLSWSNTFIVSLPISPLTRSSRLLTRCAGQKFPYLAILRREQGGQATENS
jgi:hypothetical protein